MSSSEGPAAATINIMDNPVHLSFSHFCSELDDLLCNFHDFSETTTVIDELEEFYKPFYPVATTPDFSTVTISQPVPEEIEALKQPSDKVAVQDLQEPAASKSKKSRNKKQKNKRVQHVTEAEGVSDQWAWRKYGQKPIKGSPFPRSYYRCSSCKGCLARKQVERSHLDPAVFIVSYTAEHSHPQPTRKNSQARNSTGKNWSTVIAPPRTHDEQSTLNSPNLTPDQTPVVVEPITDEHAPISTVELSKGVKKEEGAVEDNGLFQSIELEELNGLDQQLFALDGYGF